MASKPPGNDAPKDSAEKGEPGNKDPVQKSDHTYHLHSRDTKAGDGGGGGGASVILTNEEENVGGDGDDDVMEEDEDKTCAICRRGEWDSPAILKCNHTFCAMCIASWMWKTDYCPVCHQEVEYSERRDLILTFYFKIKFGLNN